MIYNKKIPYDMYGRPKISKSQEEDFNKRFNKLSMKEINGIYVYISKYNYYHRSLLWKTSPFLMYVFEQKYYNTPLYQAHKEYLKKKAKFFNKSKKPLWERCVHNNNFYRQNCCILDTCNQCQYHKPVCDNCLLGLSRGNKAHQCFHNKVV